MSQANIDAIRIGYEAWNRRDAEAILAALDPAIEMKLPEGGLNAGSHRGRERVREFFEGYFEAFEEFRLEPEKFVESGDRVLVLIHAVGRGRGSGVELETRPGHLWTMRAGRAVQVEVFPEWEDALAAVGQ